MTIENENGTSSVAVEEGKAETPAVENTQNGGEKVTQPKQEELQPFKVFKTQSDFDNESAKIRGAVERNFLKKLGIKDEADLEKVKNAYEASLTQEEKNAQALLELDTYKKQVTQKDFIITALAKSTNEAIEDVENQVIMAESLLSANRFETFEEAFEFVRGTKSKKEEKPPVPQGKKLEQPETQAQIKNPFKKGDDYSLQAQVDLIKQDKELAKRLAKEAGLNI